MNLQIVVIGNFDGVHRGHQAVLADAAGRARERSVGCSLLTFSPHPAVVLGRAAPPLLTAMPRKLELVRRAAPDITPLVEAFDLAFAAQSPRAFAERVLVAHLGACEVVVGKNFRFGKARAGDFEELTCLGAELGFSTRSHELLGDAAGPWSSTRVRDAIARGDVAEAARILGRPHMLSGVVVRGDQRGRTIGVPTCNLGGPPEALPKNGVYAVLVDRVDGGAARVLAKGVANVGVRPTVKDADHDGAASGPKPRVLAGPGARPTVEVHLFDTDEDLYGVELRVHLVARLRDEKRFDGLDALKAQIVTDAAEARAHLAGAAPAAGDAWW